MFFKLSLSVYTALLKFLVFMYIYISEGSKHYRISYNLRFKTKVILISTMILKLLVVIIVFQNLQILQSKEGMTSSLNF